MARARIERSERRARAVNYRHRQVPQAPSEPGEIAGLEGKEAVIIQLGREALGEHKVSSETFARALKQFGKQGLVNVVTLMAHYTATSMVLTTFDQHLSPGQKSLLPLP